LKNENGKFDDLVKSPQIDFSVIPMEMGIQSFQYIGRTWFPACAGKTTFYEFINLAGPKKSHVHSAVHIEHLAGNVIPSRAGQKEDRLRNVLRSSQPL
jgi:hypothetical protein